MIQRYELYCEYHNQSPDCQVQKSTLGKYVLWTDHADTMTKMKNCVNCKSSTSDGEPCKTCSGNGGNKWEMK